MTNKRALLILSGTGILVIMALTLMWGTLVGAAPSGASTGVIDVDPAAVSPDEDRVPDADRTVTITVTDADLDSASYVGTGPNDEPNVFGDDDDGITVTVNASQLGATGVVPLKVSVDLNDDGTADDTSPIGDYDGDGDIDVNDVVIVNTDLDGDGRKGDIAVAEIFNASRGQIRFSVFEEGLSASQSVQIRYVAAVRQLTRAPKTYTENFDVDDLGLADGLEEDGTVDIGLMAARLPLQDANNDGKVDLKDVTVTAVGVSGVTLKVTALGGADTIGSYVNGSAAGTTITVLHDDGPTIEADKKIRISYTGLEDLVTVRGAEDVTHFLRLRETSPSSGVFAGKIKAINGEDAAVEDVTTYSLMPGMDRLGEITQIAVIEGDNITVTYKDRSNAANVGQTIIKIIDVDPDPPTFTNISPVDRSSTNDLESELSVEVSDTVGGVNPSETESVEFWLSVDEANPELQDADDVAVAETSSGSGVYKVSFPINKIPEVKSAIDDDTDLELSIRWEVKVKDVAGNLGSTGDVEEAAVDGEYAAQELTIIKQSPGLSDAITGNNWDSDAGALKTASTAANADDRTSIEVQFTVPINGSSVDEDDFTVDGVVPDDAEHFSGMPKSVFLTVDALDPDATPTVAIVGEVEDAGGNTLDTGSKEAKDGIAPDLTVTFVNGNYSKSGVEISVVSDEPIAGSLPSRTVNRCVTSAEDCAVRATHSQRSSVVETRKEWTFNMSGFSAGRYSLVVEARDTKGNLVSVGSSNSKATGALAFEIDKVIPAPEREDDDGNDVLNTHPAPGGKITLAETTLLRIIWDTESDEYTGDSHGMVELSKVELDGVDVSDQVSTRNNKNFTVTVAKSLLGATEEDQLGKHALVFNGTDEAGNTRSKDLTLNFTVELRELYEVNLNPGINLVSLPADPASTAINDLITSDDNINLVFTYNPNDPRGPWLFASRESVDDPFVGDLETIDGNHAYFMRAISDVELKIDVPPPDPGRPAPPKTLTVVQGWNLVPVSDITRQAFDSKLDADAYLTGVDWTRALTYDSLQPQPWVVVSPGQDDELKVGFGYWLWANEPGQIIPGAGAAAAE